ncbi:MAG: type II toxin-antitoxin system VapC family toxin [Deltaproteobacteria bacterium]|nr:type II toxin-antitoxin system VapC family toxin [Deltaproteobacteria bacterium]
MILDTCGLLWLVHDQNKMSHKALEIIKNSPVLYISAISSFEIGLKYKAGKLLLPAPPKEWFQEIIKHHDISIINLDKDICLKATELPDIHRDPCDRFIIATALIKKMAVITADTRFQEYGVTVYI